MENIKANIKGIVGSCTGVPINELESEYYTLMKTRLNYQDFGFKSLHQFLEHITDVVDIVEIHGQLIVKMAISPSDSSTLINLKDLVAATKTKKKVNKSYSVQQNNNKVVRAPTLEDLKISVTNNHYRDSYNGRGYVSRDDPAFFDRPAPPRHLKDMTNGSPRHSVYEPLHRNIVSTPKYGYNNGDAIISNGIKKEDFDKVAKNAKAVTEETLDYGCWFVKPEITFETAHAQVKIIGIQSGYAVVMRSGTPPKQAFLELKNAVTIYPGDLVFWQPPFVDSERTKNLVDVNSAFPAIIIRRIDMKRVQVRIMALPILVDVSICDLFNLPSTGKDLAQTIKRIRLRDTTLLRLAFIPTTTNIYDEAAYNDTYSVVFSVDDGSKVLECTNKPGNFLNVDLLTYVKDKLVLSSDVDEKKAFLQHVSNCIDRSMAAMKPVFEKLVADKDNCHPEKDPLRLVYNVAECGDQVLLGCKNVLRGGQSGMEGPKMHMLSRDGLSLHRMGYWGSKKTFYCYDDQNEEVPMSQSQLPLVGLYIVNRAFTESTEARDNSLRVRTALLTTVPNLMGLAVGLGLYDL